MSDSGTSIALPGPRLERFTDRGVSVWVDPGLAEAGIAVAFTERGGGASSAPYDSLNLAAHVGDDLARVDENRSRVLALLGMSDLRDRLVSAVQVHGDRIRLLGGHDAGRGAFASGGRNPVPGTDAMVTLSAGMPLVMLYADCVPLVLATLTPVRCVAVVHAGWKGALARLPEKAVRVLCDAAGCEARSARAYVGPRIGPCCYRVDKKRASLFAGEFDTIAPVDGGLDIRAAVCESLADAGIDDRNVAVLDACTFDDSGSYFSFRASPVTGRHAALVAIAKGI
ncbi:MAG: polyphenol oxidase family protein [Actinomycetota bacterium]|nr:polyphenol oxidase family protein [Actinomycetota bacterium]